MARSQGWAGIIQMTNPINGTDQPINAYIEGRAKNRRKAVRVLENMAKDYYPMFREHCALATSELDAGGSVMEAHIMDYRIDELICDDDIVSLAEEHATGVTPTPVVTPAVAPVITTPVVQTTTVVYGKPRKIFSDDMLSKISATRYTYTGNLRSVYKTPEGETAP